MIIESESFKIFLTIDRSSSFTGRRRINARARHCALKKKGTTDVLIAKNQPSRLDGDRRENVRGNVVFLERCAVCGLPMAGRDDRGG